MTTMEEIAHGVGDLTGGRVGEPDDVKTMRLRYAGSCSGCGCALDAGTRAHYLKSIKEVRCLGCGPGVPDSDERPPAPVESSGAHSPGKAPPTLSQERVAAVQGPARRAGTCGDCGRRLRAADEALVAQDGAPLVCVECVTLDKLHTLGVPGAGARREHGKRLQRHETRVRVAHPRLGGVLLAMRDEPSHVRAWQSGAVGEEEFGQKLSSIACERLKVLHDRKIPRSSANIDHLAVTSDAVWVLDAKRYKGKVETRGQGLFSRRPPDLFVGGRNQSKLVEGVKKQVAVVQAVLADLGLQYGVRDVPVRGALAFVNAEFGLFSSPFVVDEVWIGWGKALRKRLGEQSAGSLPVADIAKCLARELKAG